MLKTVVFHNVVYEKSQNSTHLVFTLKNFETKFDIFCFPYKYSIKLILKFEISYTDNIHLSITSTVQEHELLIFLIFAFKF